MSDSSRTYDVVVLGAGPAGENLAERTSAAGLTSVIVENELLGGECSFWACEPSKALLRPVVARADARRIPGLRRAVEGPLDIPAVFAYRDKMSANWQDENQVDWLNSVSVDLVRGHGRLDGPRQVVVQTPDGDTVRLTARHVVGVCTGTVTAFPNLPGLESVRPWTNREATAARSVPDRLAVVGGGVVAVEMATAWQALGSQVTLLVRGSGLLHRMEPFAGEMVAASLEEAGVDLRFGVTVSEVARQNGPDSPVQITLSTGDSLTADEILIATGRSPHTADIGLETVGLTPGDWLVVDDTYRVSAITEGWLYSVGDVNHRALMTHQGKYQARIAGAIIGARAQGKPLDIGKWGAHASTADIKAVPQVIFTDPDVVSVGLTTPEAEHTGRPVDVVDYDLAHLAGSAQYAEGYRGKARMLIDADHGTVLGVTFVGPGVQELLYSATVAVTTEATVEQLWHAVPAFPTISEVWLRLLETYRDRAK
ncbi:dihydrolipoyl dehydrogenase family protein [Streptomyces sp. NBC_00887]|uniref:dihydrolipoyl dehydrogenase family protein n=1 Tax=Streptomyces sp. NBC_00887 TaxID=2975859 RepID=UPI00386A0F85|nr:NAD(P)/FAD-dependent oxidoreductase [Streptomyces sp. NBC_00887]WSY36847.1 NAD(P)/FAD-dependent oxidoreductase [Streptomyces sp. NBC_00887]